MCEFSVCFTCVQTFNSAFSVNPSRLLMAPVFIFMNVCKCRAAVSEPLVLVFPVLCLLSRVVFVLSSCTRLLV